MLPANAGWLRPVYSPAVLSDFFQSFFLQTGQIEPAEFLWAEAKNQN
jgi:hypothetical protein